MNFYVIAFALLVLGGFGYWSASWYANLLFADFVLVAAIIVGLLLAAYIRECTLSIDAILEREFGANSSYSVLKRDFPRYASVDVFRAIESITEKYSFVGYVKSEHNSSLTEILNRKDDSHLQKPTALPFMVDLDEEVFLPADGFWAIDIFDESSRLLIRLRLIDRQMAVLEVASQSEETAERVVQEISTVARKDSIYRGKCIELQFDSSADTYGDVYGDVPDNDPVTISFKPRTEVTDDDIILEPRVREILERNVVDFHNRREELAHAGLPSKRGILLYGPPGTGKTFTCKHVAHRLPTATVIFAVGHSLLHVKSVCNVARMLQPTVVVLEDVDLVFSTREANPYVTALGTLLDELDGIADDDQIVFILTTNAIERVEDAVKNRPGRISQCLHIAAPGPELREKYFHRLLQDYQAENVDIGALVEMTDGSSQAFIKELVFRSVQMSLENGQSGNGQIRLDSPTFRRAIDEMTDGADNRGMSIIGFKH